MEKTEMVIRKKVEGRVDYNDGEFAEVQTVGIEGIEQDLLLETIQIHADDTIITILLTSPGVGFQLACGWTS